MGRKHKHKVELAYFYRWLYYQQFSLPYLKWIIGHKVFTQLAWNDYKRFKK